MFPIQRAIWCCDTLGEHCLITVTEALPNVFDDRVGARRPTFVQPGYARGRDRVSHARTVAHQPGNNQPLSPPVSVTYT
jgi:hypothetical protein